MAEPRARRSNRKLRWIAATAAAAALVLSGLTNIVSAPPAVAAVTPTLYASTSVAAMATQAAGLAFPSGATEAIIASSTDQTIAEASAIAAKRGIPLLVSASTSENTAIKPVLTGLGVTSVRLVGAFSASFKTGLGSTVLSETTPTTATPFQRTTAAFAYLPASPIVVASTQIANSVSVGAATAIVQGANLVVLDGSESDAAITSFFANRADKRITVVGAATTLKMNLLPTLGEEMYAVIDPISIQTSFTNLALDSVRAGKSGTKVWVAPSDQRSSVAIGALVAHQRGNIFAPAGTSAAFGTSSAAHSLVGAWGPETVNISLLGVSVTAAQLATLTSKTTTARLPAPGFSVSDVALGASSYTITVAPKTGAVRYEAIASDEDSTVVGTSTTSTITVAGLPGTVGAILAYNNANQEIASFPMRINDYQVAADRASAMVGQIDMEGGGKHYLNWLDNSAVPRLITAYAVDPTQPPDSVDPLGVTEMVALTCGGHFTTPPRDLTKQWVYQVETLSTLGVSCGTGPSALTTNTGSGVNLPFMQWPSAMRGADTADSRATPGLTIADSMVQNMVDGDPSMARGQETSATITSTAEELLASAPETVYIEDDPAALRGPGDDMYPMVVGYVQYIPWAYIPFPDLPTLDPWRPLTAFAGDNRAWWDVNGSNKTSNLSTVRFGSNPSVTSVRKVIQTKKYKCTLLLTDCILTATGQAPLSGVQTTQVPGATRAIVHQRVSSTIPLVPMAPAIDGQVTWDLKRGGSSVTGWHDLMPRHQLWYGNLNSEAWLAWQNAKWSLPCLYGGFGCTARLNVQF